MSEFIGREINFAVATEDSRGVAESLAARTVRKVSCNIIPRAERVIDNTTFGRLEDAERVRTVRKWNEGDVEGIVHVDVLGYYLTNLYGDVESEHVTGIVYKHTFELEQNIVHPTLTFFVKDAEVRQEKIAGGVVSTLSLTASTDQYVRYTANFLGKEGEADTSELPELSTEYDFVSRDIEIKIAESAEGLGDATALKVKNLSIDWNSNAEADWVFGDYSPDNIYNKQMSIEGLMTLNYAGTELQELYDTDAFRYMSIDIIGEESLADENKPYIKINFNKVQITDWGRTSSGDEISTQEVSFKAFYNTTDEKASSVEIQNTTEEYILGS